MTGWHIALIGGAAALMAYVATVVALMVLGRRDHARAVAGFVPDCLVLFRRLLADPSVPRRAKLVLAATCGYLAVPLDLIPDFIPVAGQLDDAVVVAVSLRFTLRSVGPERLRQHWPGPEASLSLVARLAGYS